MQKTSIVWDTPKQELEEIVKKATTFSEILPLVGLQNKGDNVSTLKRRLVLEQINFDHILDKTNFFSKTNMYRKTFSSDSIFIENSPVNRQSVKKRIFKEKLLPNNCAICGAEPIWQDKSLVLILDHINGESNDHRLENLRLVCPNCNSQLDTHCGKHKKRYTKEKQEEMKIERKRRRYVESSICLVCGKEHYNKKYCSQECAWVASRKCEHPSKEILLKLLETFNMCEVGRMYGVSDNAVRKWLK